MTERTAKPGHIAVAPGEPPVVDVQGLWTTFGKGNEAFSVHQDLQLSVQRGEILALVGGSGTGKTVLLRQMLGLAWPTRGSVTVLGQPGDTLVAQHGEGARGNGGLVVDGDADQHVARNLGVKTNARDLANCYALVAHGGLWLQAGNAVLAGQLVVLVTGVVAGEPDRQTRQHGGHRQHEDASGKGVGFVFHQDSLAVTALCTGAMARWPRSPRKKCSMNG